MTFYKKIDKPKQFRKTLLESARDSVLMIKKEDALSEIRTMKKDLISDLKSDYQELLNKSKELDELLKKDETKKKLDEEARNNYQVQKVEVEEKEPPVEKTEEEKTSNTSEMDRLDYTLNKIEEKLKNV